MLCRTLARSRGGPSLAFAAAAAQLQLRLLGAYLALPDASAFTMEHAAVSKLCARALRSAPGQAGSGRLERMLKPGDLRPISAGAANIRPTGADRGISRLLEEQELGWDLWSQVSCWGRPAPVASVVGLWCAIVGFAGGPLNMQGWCAPIA